MAYVQKDLDLSGAIAKAIWFGDGKIQYSSQALEWGALAHWL